MEIGASIFFTDYSMASTDLAVALEQRGFDSLWVAEHSHMPVTHRFTHPLGEAALTKEYFDVMASFVTLSAAAAVTTRLKLGTAVCLVIQRDTTVVPRPSQGRGRPIWMESDADTCADDEVAPKWDIQTRRRPQAAAIESP
jgi:alkanesulfonate monooxygenase SsuD/methylene tetrahydromethanopterin reductase-like flavin-dependent oxidoreductase (luciferase family)